MKKFLSTKERTHIDLAAVHGENSLDAASESDPRLHVRCNNLAMSLHRRLQAGFSSSMLDDITRAIGLLERASKLAGDGSASSSGYLNNIGLARLSKIESFGDSDGTGVEKAIKEFSTALTLVRSTSPLSGGIMLNLARTWRRKYEQDDSKIDDDIKKAIAFAQGAVNSPSASLKTRIKAGYLGGLWATQIARCNEDRQQAAQLLRAAANLIPLLSPRHMALKDRIRNLAEFNAMDITADAVAAALDAGSSGEIALQLLESSWEI